MTTPPPPPLGSIGWADLTVPDPVGVSDFYAKVAGWTGAPLSMGDYDDFVIMAPGGTAGGEVLSAPRSAGAAARFAVIQDPAGAAVALFESGAV